MAIANAEINDLIAEIESIDISAPSADWKPASW